MRQHLSPRPRWSFAVVKSLGAWATTVLYPHAIFLWWSYWFLSNHCFIPTYYIFIFKSSTNIQRYRLRTQSVLDRRLGSIPDSIILVCCWWGISQLSGLISVVIFWSDRMHFWFGSRLRESIQTECWVLVRFYFERKLFVQLVVLYAPLFRGLQFT